MRKAAALACAAVVIACLACTFDIPDIKPSSSACTSALCACKSVTDCTSGICAESETVGEALFAAAGGAAFCTSPCCTSADCAAGTACFASGQGGSYCVDPEWLGRAALGSNRGGEACRKGLDCRSGLCGAGTCLDACCSLAGLASECFGDTQCSFGTFPGATALDRHFAAFCQPSGGSGAYGSSCTADAQCLGGLCYTAGGGECTNPCRSITECGSGNTCVTDQQGSDDYAACFPLILTMTVPTGSGCVSDLQCVGGWCDTSSRCTNICLTDADCDGGHCVVQQASGPHGTFFALACGI